MGPTGIRGPWTASEQGEQGENGRPGKRLHGRTDGQELLVNRACQENQVRRGWPERDSH